MILTVRNSEIMTFCGVPLNMEREAVFINNKLDIVSEKKKQRSES